MTVKDAILNATTTKIESENRIELVIGILHHIIDAYGQSPPQLSVDEYNRIHKKYSRLIIMKNIPMLVLFESIYGAICDIRPDHELPDFSNIRLTVDKMLKAETSI